MFKLLKFMLCGSGGLLPKGVKGGPTDVAPLPGFGYSYPMQYTEKSAPRPYRANDFVLKIDDPHERQLLSVQRFPFTDSAGFVRLPLSLSTLPVNLHR